MIDWNHVNELRDDVGADDFDEVVALFLEEVDEIVARLPKSTDPHQIEADYHALKGCAQGLGFRTFARLCQASEQLCKNQKISEINRDETLRSYRDSRRVFLEQLPTSLAG